MTLLQLRYAVKIAECGSMNEAAHQLYVSQPTLSSAVHDLERELGIIIFTRTTQGISLTPDGAKFLMYARQVLDQADVLENRFVHTDHRDQITTVSTQHFMFAVEAFARLLKDMGSRLGDYEFTLRETRTRDIIDQVARLRSEVGILFLSDYNREVLGQLLRTRRLEFHPVFRVKPHIFLSEANPLARRKILTLDDLADQPFLRYEQGDSSSLFFAEEAVWPEHAKSLITVGDRATLLNLIQTVDGFTVSTGVSGDNDLRDTGIATVPLDSDMTMVVGWVSSKHARLSPGAIAYVRSLRRVIQSKGFELMDGSSKF
jgi:DNA-binding transcriptional LysR family regulator